MGKVLRFKHPTILTLSHYHDNELHGSEKAGVTNHLKRCGLCAMKLKKFERVGNMMRVVGRKRGRR